MEDERLDNQIEEAAEPLDTAGRPPAPALDGDASQAEVGVASAAAEDGTSEQPAETEADPTAVPRRWPLKLVLDLRPRPKAGYRALLAVGSDGCDPLMRSVEARDVAEALEQVAGLVAAAEERWAVSTRYPTAAAPAKKPAVRAQSTASPPSPQPPTEGETQPIARPEPEPAAEPASDSRDQLSLFG